MKTPKTDWSGIQRESSEKAHQSEVASLRLQLDHAQAQIERMQKSHRAKIILVVNLFLDATERGFGYFCLQALISAIRRRARMTRA